MTVVGDDVRGTSAQVQAGAAGVSAGWRPRRVRRAAGLLVLVVGMAGLTACSGQPGAAAIVDGEVITPGELHSALDELGPYLSSPSTSAVLTILVQAPAVSAVAAEHGVAVSTEDAQAALSDVAAADGIDGSDFSEASLTIAKFSVEYSALTQLDDAEAINAELVDRVSALDVEVNPRFGSLDAGNFVSDPVTNPWIVQPEAGAADESAQAPTDTPSPSPSE
ncbi:hypothetical protein ACTHAM_000571 [Cellulomonas soli]